MGACERRAMVFARRGNCLRFKAFFCFLLLQNSCEREFGKSPFVVCKVFFVVVSLVRRCGLFLVGDAVIGSLKLASESDAASVSSSGIGGEGHSIKSKPPRIAFISIREYLNSLKGWDVPSVFLQSPLSSFHATTGVPNLNRIQTTKLNCSMVLEPYFPRLETLNVYESGNLAVQQLIFLSESGREVHLDAHKVAQLPLNMATILQASVTLINDKVWNEKGMMVIYYNRYMFILYEQPPLLKFFLNFFWHTLPRFRFVPWVMTNLPGKSFQALLYEGTALLSLEPAYVNTVIRISEPSVIWFVVSEAPNPISIEITEQRFVYLKQPSYVLVHHQITFSRHLPQHYTWDIAICNHASQHIHRRRAGGHGGSHPCRR